MKHYPLYELDQFRNKEYSLLSQIRCRIHLLRCLKCKKRLARLYTDDLLIQELQKTFHFFESQEETIHK